MKIYHYHPFTGEYLGEADADESPLEKGVYLIPAYATDIAPQMAGKNKTPVFSEGKWAVRDDFRGSVFYDTATGERHELSAIGEAPDPSWTNKTPGENTVWDGNSWVQDISALREKTWRRLEADMHHHIFVTHDYPTPTQITLQALFGDPSSNEAVRLACREIFEWVKKSVLPYYYTKKSEILASDTPELVEWDFPKNCDENAPGYTLKQIIDLGQK